jgi:hypothetical protein
MMGISDATPRRTPATIATRNQHPSAAFLACTTGMLAGSLIDLYDGDVAKFAALCIVGDRSLLYSLCLHWRELPATYAGMLLGGVLAASHSAAARRNEAHRWLQALRAVVCYGSMLAGMEVGMLAVARAFSNPQSPAVMLATMLLGMASGLILASSLPRPATR